MKLCQDRVQWLQENISTIESNAILVYSSYVCRSTFTLDGYVLKSVQCDLSL
jgi:hypothetical protein